MSLIAIIVAAGSSSRMGFDKMFAELDFKPVVEHTIDAFERCPAVGEIILIAHPDRTKDIMRVVEEGGFEKVTHIAKGGATRRDSVSHGLRDITDESGYVAVHDGARPWITGAQIEKVLAAAAEHGAASSARPITDTVKRADDSGRVTGAVEREGLWAMETPQIFRTDLLKRAYAKALADKVEVTDEVSAVELLGEPVFLVQNDTQNPKVTFPSDLTRFGVPS
jgi:2-C-methyl-D-erythritol 4-phosphate cytidylyltransferase